MKIAIHQPEHFPYMGFFEKMRYADVFVILDNVKFRKNYFQNRNKFFNEITEKDEWFGVSVPKKSTSLMIKDVEVVDPSINNWKRKTINKLKHNFKQDFTSIYSHKSLIDINMSSIDWARKQLKIDNKIVFASNLHSQGSKTELLYNICKELGASTYVSGQGGKMYLEEKLFKDIKIEYFQPNVENYYSCVCNILK